MMHPLYGLLIVMNQINLPSDILHFKLFLRKYNKISINKCEKTTKTRLTVPKQPVSRVLSLILILKIRNHVFQLPLGNHIVFLLIQIIFELFRILHIHNMAHM